MTKIAAIYWPTSSVGGINTCMMNLRAEADRRGDTFHVLRSGLHKFRPSVFAERKEIRGGDTFITIDGEAPHHPSVVAESANFINSNYDRVYIGYACPHPTKAYGDRPLWLSMYRDLLLPLSTRITDAYLGGYLDWAQQALPFADVLTCSHLPVVQELADLGFKAQYTTSPVFPRKVAATKSKTLLTVWTSQWKAIKGIHKLLPLFREFDGAVELYSNGILYYQLRTTDAWKASVGKDHFKGFNGHGKATFFGNVDMSEIPNILTRSWFMLDLMGMGRPKYKSYTMGTFNNTTKEALLYGSCPILHRQASKVIPKDLALFVDDASEVPDIVNDKRSHRFALDPERIKKAREWVMKLAGPSATYDSIIYGRKS